MRVARKNQTAGHVYQSFTSLWLKHFSYGLIKTTDVQSINHCETWGQFFFVTNNFTVSCANCSNAHFLFVLGFTFHSYGNITFTVEGLQILTYNRHSRPLSSETSSVCNIYCETGHPFTCTINWSSPRTLYTYYTVPSFGNGALATGINELGLPRLGIEPRSSGCESNTFPTRSPEWITNT